MTNPDMVLPLLILATKLSIIQLEHNSDKKTISIRINNKFVFSQPNRH